MGRRISFQSSRRPPSLPYLAPDRETVQAAACHAVGREGPGAAGGEEGGARMAGEGERCGGEVGEKERVNGRRGGERQIKEKGERKK